jgi:hypothetical protein
VVTAAAEVVGEAVAAEDLVVSPWLFRSREAWDSDLEVIEAVDGVELVVRDSTIDVIGVRGINGADGPIVLEPNRNFSSIRVRDRSIEGESRVFDGAPGRFVRVAVAIRD